MGGFSLSVAASLSCPHGGSVQVAGTSTRVTADGAFVGTATDSWIITGCPFQIPATPPIPSPCVQVQWVVPDMRVRVAGNPTLSMGSVGLCLSATSIPQGPVIVAATQTRVSSQ
jgi:hypothetical protein